MYMIGIGTIVHDTPWDRLYCGMYPHMQIFDDVDILNQQYTN